MQQKGGCSAIYHAIGEDDVVRILGSPYTMIASDGEIPAFGQAAPHPRSYGTFARVLGVYVREKDDPDLGRGRAPHVGLSRRAPDLADRGLLRPGMKADVVLFDPDKIGDESRRSPSRINTRWECTT